MMIASSSPIPSNPQVRILPFLHHSMLLLSNQPSEAKAVTSNPHPLFPLSLTNCLDGYKPLNTQSNNRQLPHHSNGEEKSDRSTARSSRSRFIRKIVREQQGLVLRALVSKLKRFNSMG